MMTKAEKLVEKIIAECQKNGEPVTLADAIEMAKMELGAKEIKNYTQSTLEKAKGKREIKKDEIKISFISQIAEMLVNIRHKDRPLEQITIANEQRVIDFHFNGEHYSLTLTKHKGAKN